MGCKLITFTNGLKKSIQQKSPDWIKMWLDNKKYGFVCHETNKQSKKKQKKNNSCSNKKRKI